jgi:hypothetical protein
MRSNRSSCNFARIVGSWPLLVIVEREVPYAAHGHYVGEVERLLQATGYPRGHDIGPDGTTIPQQFPLSLQAQ